MFRSIDLCVLRDVCQEICCVFGDFHGSGTQKAEVTKSLIFFLFSNVLSSKLQKYLRDQDYRIEGLIIQDCKM